ncbi:MAG: radical SAM protein, partial [Nanoarchaeota archaeon]
MPKRLEDLVTIQSSRSSSQREIERKDFRVLITYPNYTKMLTPSYAVGLFTAILKKQGYNVDLFDCTPYMTSHNPQELPNPAVLTNRLLVNKPFDPAFFSDVKTDLLGDFERRLESDKPHVLVFSTVVEDTWPQTRDLLKVASHYPEIKSIVGGTFTTMLSRYLDSEHKVIADPYVQCVGEGEGEDTIVDFCEAVRQGLPTNRIPGTRAKDENGNITHNPPRSLVDINGTPIPDFSLFDKSRFVRPLGAQTWHAVPIETFRGCPYTCRFCNSPTQAEIAKERLGVDFRRRKNMDVLKKEITTLLEQNNGDFLYINDDAFMARPMPEIDAFIEMYGDIRVPFWMQTRFEDIRSEEQLARLKEVGLYRISFGLEHGNEQFRREKMDRHISNESMIEKSKIVARVGVPYSVNVIIGNPNETRELVFDTINLNRELGG